MYAGCKSCNIVFFKFTLKFNINDTTIFSAFYPKDTLTLYFVISANKKFN